MATPQIITVDNFSTLLVQSTQSRSGTPDGNIFFDQANDRIELITAEELANVDLGSGSEANPLTNALGITLQALYAFERQERGTDTTLRTYRPGTGGNFQDAGAFQFINGVKLSDAVHSSTGDDRTKVRGSGWTEFAEDGGIDRKYHGTRSLNTIEATSQPFVQIPASLSESDRQAAAPTDAARVGPLDEAFQTFGSTANTPSDTGAGNFDFTARPLITGVRTFGFTIGESTSIAAGVARIEAFSAGYGVGESTSPTNAFTEADVFGGAQIAPWTGMGFFRNASPQTQTGFVEADGDFTDEITNTGSGSLAQIRAFLDAIMKQDTDQNDNTGATGSFIPKRAEPLYTINADGKLVTRAGLYINNIAASDNQNVILTADNGDTKTFPFQNEVRVSVSDAWFNDANAWYTCFFVDGSGSLDFDTANAVIVDDASGTDVSGTPGDARAAGTAGSREVRFTFDYSGNTQAGLTGGTDKQVIFLAEGDGGSVAASAIINITNQAVITASAEAGAETNI